MGSPTSVTTENQEPQRQSRVGPRGTPTVAADHVVDAAYSNERPSRVRWLSEVPPTGVLAGVLGEMPFYYEACWLQHRCSEQRHGKTTR
jgi:hypothetical protein